MFIASNLKLLRKRSGKSQEELAQVLSLNRSTYSGYEKLSSATKFGNATVHFSIS